MALGLAGSVHGWGRLVSLFKHLGRELLYMSAFCYEDDFFGVEYAAAAQHEMQCFARLVRAVMGVGAVAAAKLAYGMPIDVLGLKVEVTLEGVQAMVTEEMAPRWSGAVQDALSSGVLPPGDASKMAGRLSFASQHAFR